MSSSTNQNNSSHRDAHNHIMTPAPIRATSKVLWTRESTELSDRGCGEEFDLTSIDFDKGAGLVPVIVQDEISGGVLMLGYMNNRALQKTLSGEVVCFFSRSKSRLWVKGETSGHFLLWSVIAVDCDRDALLVLASPQGPTCHLGRTSCFEGFPHFSSAASRAETSEWEGKEGSVEADKSIDRYKKRSDLEFLDETIARKAMTLGDQVESAESPSYTQRLLGRGPLKVAQKVGEEATELAIAAAAQSDDRVVSEAADLIYHTLVLLHSRNLGWSRVCEELMSRHRGDYDREKQEKDR